MEKVASGPGGPVPPGPWRLSCTRVVYWVMGERLSSLTKEPLTVEHMEKSVCYLLKHTKAVPHIEYQSTQQEQ